jgi:integrase
MRFASVRRSIKNASIADLAQSEVLTEVPRPRARRTLVWTVDQSRQFLENARDDNDAYYVAYVLMLVLGLRRGEVLGLGWEESISKRGRQSSPGAFSESGDNSCADLLRLLLRTQLCLSHGSV